MRTSKIFISLLLIIITAPVFSIVALSFQHTDAHTWKWYKLILENESFLNAFFLSLKVSVATAILSTVISLTVAMTWFNPFQRVTTFIVILILGLLPSDISALGFSQGCQIIGFRNSSIFFLVLALSFYCLPFGVLILWARFYFIDPFIFTSAKDMGMTKSSIVRKLIIPLSSTALLSTFSFSLLLSLNEYPRTFYLSGSKELLSEYLNGKLSAGTNESIYAGGSLLVIVTLLLIVTIGIIQKYRTQRISN